MSPAPVDDLTAGCLVMKNTDKGVDRGLILWLQCQRLTR